jgi:GH15 family glucan-1,4-alpha-glucosidase
MPNVTERFFPVLTAGEWKGQLPALREKLARAKTLTVEPNANGIYAASASHAADATSGYQNAWLRDNVMVAFAKWQAGDAESAYGTARGLGKFLATQMPRMEAIIRKPAKKEEVHQRPHVRFDARTLRELKQAWPHAQNDSLGNAVWLRFRLANEEGRGLSPEECELYGLMAGYFRAIKYWADLDSGAWEEGRKLNSSSVGAVLAGLREMNKYMDGGKKLPGCTKAKLEGLVEHGQQTLAAQLPFEAPPERKSDAALLFLINPLEIVKDRGLSRIILSLVRARLMGRVGIRRYIGDSYFCQDYDEWFAPEARSADFSNRLDLRDEFLAPGCEAQWCLFDSLISAIYGRRFAEQPEREALLQLQLEHLNRAIGQITAAGECPEMYYLKKGVFTANEHTPLAWAQANLSLAVQQMEKSSGIR